MTTPTIPKININNYRIYDINTSQNVQNLHKMQIIHKTYKQQRAKINYTSNEYLINKYTSNFTSKSNFWGIFSLLDGIIDLSDPDTSLPNSIHALQTAEAIRKSPKNYPDWMPLVGLIHDMGKILYINGCDLDGTSKTTQWSIVGDTFITGCPLVNSLILPEYNILNLDQQDGINIYEYGCGLRKCSISFGHDEYMYRLLLANSHTMPLEADYIIRYHSLYAWHSGTDYDYLQDNTDIKMKPIVKEFSQFDLYTKNDTLPIKWTTELNQIYSNLVKKYINDKMIIKW